MKIGAQLYTVRDYAQTVPDLAVTLRKIAEMGYRTVQCSQVGPIDPYLIKEMLDENNLQCVMTHVAPDRLLNDLPTVIAEHRILGCTNIGLGAMPERYRGSLEGCLAMVRNFSPVARNIRDAGMQFHYHNKNVKA